MSTVFSHPAEEEHAEEIHRKLHKQMKERNDLNRFWTDNRININWNCMKEYFPSFRMKISGDSTPPLATEPTQTLTPEDGKGKKDYLPLQKFAPIDGLGDNNSHSLPQTKRELAPKIIIRPILKGRILPGIYMWCFEDDDLVEKMFDLLKNSQIDFALAYKWAEQEDLEGCIYVENSDK